MKRFYQTIVAGAFVVTFLLIASVSYAAHYTTVWNGENGQNHMNFLIVSAILEDMPMGINNEIAVFSGTKCVGTAILTKVLNSADNTSFVSISASQDDGSNNGFIDSDTIIFKIWDNQNQKEMLAKAVSYRKDVSTWSSNGKFSAGSTAVVELVSYAELTQTIQLIKGYNMISTYVNAPNPDVCIVTKSLYDQGFLIKLQDETGNSYENWGVLGGWINKIGAISKTEGYKIKVANNCSFQVTGRPVVLPLSIALKSGWNIISFPNTEIVNAVSVVQSLIDLNKLVKVQDEIGNSIEDWGIYGGWKNGIGSFTPGKAYKIKVNGDVVLTIQKSYLKSAIAQINSEKTEHFTTDIEGNGVDHMNINIVGLKDAGLGIGSELAAFDGNLCVGTIEISEINIENGFAGLIASSSTDEANQTGFSVGHRIKILAWNKTSGNESIVLAEALNGDMNYAKNGSVLVKLKALTTGIKSIDEAVKIVVFPNPCTSSLNVRFSEIPVAGSKITIFDLSGRNIASKVIEGTSEVFNLSGQPSGIYFVKSIVGTTENIQKLIVN